MRLRRRAPAPITAADGLVEIIFGTDSQCKQMSAELSDEIRIATEAVYAEFARKHGAAPETLDRYDRS